VASIHDLAAPECKVIRDVKHFIDVGRYSGAFSVHQHDQLKAASGIATGETTCSVSSFLQLLLPECW